MSDDIDETNEREAFLLAQNITTIRESAAKFDKGAAGECDQCGAHVPRIVFIKAQQRSLCCHCRDAHNRVNSVQI